MDKNAKENAKAILNNYLETKKHRKTPERYAILDAVFSIGGHFNLVQLSDYLEKRSFRVSRATLYNTLRLFLELRLVTRHRLQDGTKYEARYANESHSHQICTICGKVTEVNAPTIVAAINEAKLKRFYPDGFSLYIYGICSNCHAKISRLNNTRKHKQTKNKD